MSIQTPNPKDSSVALPSVPTSIKPLTTDPTSTSVQPPASHYYSNFAKNQPSTPGNIFFNLSE